MVVSGVSREEAVFIDAHGVRIHHYRWPAEAPRGVVQLVHGLGEYATRYEQYGFVPGLVAAGYTVVAHDHRGHGRTGLEQWGGDHAKLGRLGPGGWRAAVAATYRLTALTRERHPGLPLVLLGHSLGSIVAQELLAEHAEDYDAAVLSGTAYRTLLDMNAGDLNKRHAGLGPTTAEWLSRDRAVVDAFVADPLTFEAKTLALFGLADSLRLLGTPHRLAKDVPLLIMIGEEDSLGGPESVAKLARAYGQRGGLTDITLDVYPEARHELFNETNREEVLADLVAWLDSRVGAAEHPPPDAG